MTDDELQEVLSRTIGAYLDDMEDPGDVDTDDLAENIVRELRRAGL